MSTKAEGKVRIVQVTPAQVLALQLAERAAATAGDAARELYPASPPERLRQVTHAITWWATEAAPRIAEHPEMTDEQIDSITDHAALELLCVVLGPPPAAALN